MSILEICRGIFTGCDELDGGGKVDEGIDGFLGGMGSGLEMGACEGSGTTGCSFHNPDILQNVNPIPPISGFDGC